LPAWPNPFNVSSPRRGVSYDPLIRYLIDEGQDVLSRWRNSHWIATTAAISMFVSSEIGLIASVEE